MLIDPIKLRSMAKAASKKERALLRRLRNRPKKPDHSIDLPEADRLNEQVYKALNEVFGPKAGNVIEFHFGDGVEYGRWLLLEDPDVHRKAPIYGRKAHELLGMEIFGDSRVGSAPVYLMPVDGEPPHSDYDFTIVVNGEKASRITVRALQAILAPTWFLRAEHVRCVGYISYTDLEFLRARVFGNWTDCCDLRSENMEHRRILVQLRGRVERLSRIVVSQ